MGDPSGPQSFDERPLLCPETLNDDPIAAHSHHDVGETVPVVVDTSSAIRHIGFECSELARHGCAVSYGFCQRGHTCEIAQERRLIGEKIGPIGVPVELREEPVVLEGSARTLRWGENNHGIRLVWLDLMLPLYGADDAAHGELTIARCGG